MNKNTICNEQVKHNKDDKVTELCVLAIILATVLVIALGVIGVVTSALLSDMNLACKAATMIVMTVVVAKLLDTDFIKSMRSEIKENIDK